MGLQAAELLREGLLEGVTVAVAAAPDGTGQDVGLHVREAAASLGAQVAAVELAAGEDAEADEARAQASMSAALEQLGSLGGLVVDAAGLFAPGGGRESLMGSLAACWNAARAAAGAALIESGGGRILLLGPPAGSEHAAAAVAGLENTARTLSIEWARYAITTVAVAPGEKTGPDELAALACWLLSPAGSYFSGCLLDLRGPAAAG